MSILTLDIGATAVKYGLFDQNGILFKQGDFPTQAQNGAQSLFVRLTAWLHASPETISAIGVSTCGQVDRFTGHIMYATDNLPEYTGMQVRSYLEETFSVPVVVENDANAAAIGEAYFGSAKGVSDFLCITYGTGIGGAIISDNRIYRGKNGAAGEFGHIITHADGLPCTCGGKGCYETYASVTALCRCVRTVTGQALSSREIMMRIQEDSIADALKGWIHEVAIGLSSLIHALNPYCIILGGGIMENPQLLHLIRKETLELVMPAFRGTLIVGAALGNQAALYGMFHLLRDSVTKGNP